MLDIKNKSVVLLSGGLDSTVLLHYVVKSKQEDVTAVLINYNQRHNRELACASQNALNLKCNIININADFIGNITKNVSVLTNKDKDVPHIKDVVGLAQPPTYVPMRNLMFLSIAASVAESVKANTIYYGAAEVDTHSGHWDCTLEFLDYINKILNLNRENKIQVSAPFITYSKEQIINLGKSINVDFTLTHTCYNGEAIACGTCSSCSSRIQGFLSANIVDPIQYAINIPWS
jgi:7-cyano-7-deazaguanine synthase